MGNPDDERFKSYRYQIPHDSFEAPPMESGHTTPADYRRVLRERFSFVVSQAITVFGVQWVQEAVEAAIRRHRGA